MQKESWPPCHNGQRAKVAIPKLNRGQPPRVDKTSRDDRVLVPIVHNEGATNALSRSRACKTCRRRKVKCSGDLPRCSNCYGNDLDCVYQQARRDRLQEAVHLNKKLVSLLADLRDRVQDSDQERIDNALNDAEADLITQSPQHIPKTSAKRTHGSSFGEDEDGVDSRDFESYVPTSVGSTDLESVSEDLMQPHELRHTGFIAPNSDVQWLRTFQQQAEGGITDIYAQLYGMQTSFQANMRDGNNGGKDSITTMEQIPTVQTTDATFYLDSEPIEIDMAVDPFAVPKPQVAEHLVNCYMRTVHSSFPIIPMHFEDQLRKYIKSIKNHRPFQIPDRWRAIMNLVFAIGAKHSNLNGSFLDHEDCNHLVYMTRAVHLLGLKSTFMVISGPDLGLVQATGLLAFYFLVIGHVSRAWLIMGMSFRFALALGLHLRNEDDSVDGPKRDSMQDTWWSLQAIESIISSVTGRPSINLSENCTVAAPRAGSTSKLQHALNDKRIPQLQDQSADLPAHPSNARRAGRTHYFAAHIRITMITQRVLSNLYSPRTASQTWEHIQTQITILLDELEQWAMTAFPQDLATEPWTRQEDFEREQFLLRISYWSTKILITQPCLCRKSRSLLIESDRVKHFVIQASEICVEAAKQMTGLLPDQTNPEIMYSLGPWWTLIYNIMQSVTVLLLELAAKREQLNGNGADLVACIKNSVDWLGSLQANDPVAGRAYQLVHKIMKTCAIPQAHEKFSHRHNSARAVPLQDLDYSLEKPHLSNWEPPTLIQRSPVGYDAIDPRLFEQQAMDFAYDNQPGVYSSYPQHQVQMSL